MGNIHRSASVRARFTLLSGLMLAGLVLLHDAFSTRVLIFTAFEIIKMDVMFLVCLVAISSFISRTGLVIILSAIALIVWSGIWGLFFAYTSYETLGAGGERIIEFGKLTDAGIRHILSYSVIRGVLAFAAGALAWLLQNRPSHLRVQGSA